MNPRQAITYEGQCGKRTIPWENAPIAQSEWVWSTSRHMNKTQKLSPKNNVREFSTSRAFGDRRDVIKSSIICPFPI